MLQRGTNGKENYMAIMNIKCKICGSEESTSIWEFREHGINKCIPMIEKYFGLNQQPKEEEQEEKDSIKKRKTRKECEIIDTTIVKKIKSSSSGGTSTTITFQNIINVPFVRMVIFNHVGQLSRLLKANNSGVGRSMKGKDIIKIPHFGMITKFGMPWNFIKHYLPPTDKVLVKRRHYVMSQYCANQNATLGTLQHLLEWSKDYDPLDPLEECHLELVQNVARAGHVDILTLLLDRFPYLDLNGFSSMRGAAKNGHLDMVCLLSKKKDFKLICESAMYEAASNGRLKIVKFLHFDCKTECSEDDLNGAAKNGHLDTLRWLYHRYCGDYSGGGGGLSAKTFDKASKNGHLATVQWLTYMKTRCSEKAIDRASQNGHLHILRYLHSNNIFDSTTDAMDNSTKIEITKFLHYNMYEGATTNAMDNAASLGLLEIVQFLHEYRTEGCSTQAMTLAAKNGHLDVVKFLYTNRPQDRSTREALNKAIKKGHRDIEIYLTSGDDELFDITLDFDIRYVIQKGRMDLITLYERRYLQESLDAQEMYLAASHGQLEVLKFLQSILNLDPIPSNIMDIASTKGYLEIVKYLHFECNSKCTIESMNGAAIYGHLNVVRFLAENRSEKCSDKALECIGEYPNYQVIEYILSNKLIPKKNILSGPFIQAMRYDNGQTYKYYETLEMVDHYYNNDSSSS
ncbi:hypothetical protein DFA_08226 [Cavenderia fasciculata]|uniref:Ankyrin repeat-containing protein n=1 Tax=Cavenderia fasciculata TaxID=261658 RepID=F4Q5H7_CACFS|nr:uncharacterized protein DFA_08226 [Cavenderia fasciculata]EGG17236.1 hypothetical protein DFA_08226 [Cavenderia fasciculata]|eukprot:XP_004355720.1 hypothetical protein DFA_08226 [Cavenderia fasciculata]